MLTFTVHGPFKIPVYQGKAARIITPDEANAFWDKNAKYRKRRGCYVFGIRSGGGVTPLYVGRATKGFKQETFQPHKLTKYQQGLADYLKGTPVLFFLAAPAGKGATNVSSIEALEDFLIQTAVSKNPELLNVKGTKQADWGIAGVVRGGVGKPSRAAKVLKAGLGL